MFTNKQSSLFNTPSKKGVGAMTMDANPFVKAAQERSALTISGNYAPKYSTTGNSFVDQFNNLGIYRNPRSYQEIERDCVTLYTQDPVMAVRFILYLRLISRRVQFADGTSTTRVQRGGGLKHESIMRMIWLHVEHPEVFWNNVALFIAVGSWKDVFEMLTVDLSYNGWEGRVLDWNKFAALFRLGASNDTQSNLFKKYMPQIQARSNCKTIRAQARTMIGKWLADVLKLSYREYRLLKTSGTAHQWQKAISRQDYSDLDFDSIHGRALSQLIDSKFIENQGLAEVYEKWIMAQPIAKFTGYVHELAMRIDAPNMCGRHRASRNLKELKTYQKHTINKQYDGLVELARQDTNVKSGLIVVRDTSSPMTSTIPGQNFSAYDVAKALGIFFGDMLDGAFKNSWIEFADTYKLHQYHADNFVDKWRGDTSEAYGSTNILAVASLFGDVRALGVSEEDFPTGIICISDGEFDNPNGASRYRKGLGLDESNVVIFKRRLRNFGFSKEYADNFQFVFWNIPNSYYGTPSAKFETFDNVENVFYLSGYDGSTLSFLLGGDGQTDVPKTAEELFEAAMNQEVLEMVVI